MISQTHVVFQLLLLIFCAIVGIASIHLAYLFALFSYLIF